MREQLIDINHFYNVGNYGWDIKMSGGYFDYNQNKLDLIINKIERLIEVNEYEYPENIIERFKIAVSTLNRAKIMSQRIDWLVSGDDGEESFLQRWKEELNG